jgi:hypothetical protein
VIEWILSWFTVGDEMSFWDKLWKLIKELLGKDDDEPDNPDDGNTDEPADPNNPPHWSDADGAPDTLIPGAKYEVKYKVNEHGEGYWYFCYKGGDGLYKPSTDLWLLPPKNPKNGQPLRMEHISKVIASNDKEGNNKIKDLNMTGYHTDNIKVRGAKVKQNGYWLLGFDIYNQKILEKQVTDWQIRQE